MRRIIISIVFLSEVLSTSGQGLRFEEIREKKPLKRGKEYQMYWTGGTTDQIVSVQLRKKDLIIKEWPSLLNSGNCLVFLPGNLKPGNYSFAIVNSSTQGFLQADQVKIRRRIPLLLKLGVPILITAIFATNAWNENGVIVVNAPRP